MWIVVLINDHSGIGMEGVLERGEATSRRLLQ